MVDTPAGVHEAVSSSAGQQSSLGLVLQPVLLVQPTGRRACVAASRTVLSIGLDEQRMQQEKAHFHYRKILDDSMLVSAMKNYNMVVVLSTVSIQFNPLFLFISHRAIQF